MKILHVIPKYFMDNEILNESLLLVNRLSELTETHVVFFEKDAENLHNSQVTFHILSCKRGLYSRLSLPSQYISVLYHVMPDIVHIHGTWNFFAANVERWSRKRGFKVVVSPHGRLRKHAWNIGFLKTRLLPTVIYQRDMVRHAYALHAINEEEKKNLATLKWNKRVETICMEQPERMLIFYQKMLNSDIHRQMSVDERQAICYLLHTALADNLWQSDRISLNRLRQLNAIQWKRIHLYAEEEHVSDLLQQGIDKLQLNIPEDFTTNLRFEPRIKKSEKALNGSDGLLSMLTEAQTLVKKHTLSLRQLATLYQAFIQLDCDEDALSKLLQEKKKSRFTARMEQILSEIFFLTDGFMPIEKRNDRKTEKIRKNII